jgi:putative membrane protein
MEKLIVILIGIIAVIHVAFLMVQMFFWNTEFVQNKFVKPFSDQEIAAILAHNQGLYNGFLAVGLIWGLILTQLFPQVPAMGVVMFFLGFIVMAGIYGSISLKRPTAILLQSLPAALALGLLWLTQR